MATHEEPHWVKWKPCWKLCMPATKELNLVFLHGMCGNPSAMEPLKNRLIDSELPPRIEEYEGSHPGVRVTINWWNPQLSNNVNIGTWAQEIATYINEHLPDKRNLIFICHSMGGKSAIYAVRHNKGGLQDKTLAVITINSPIERLDHFETTGGGHLIYEWCHSKGLLEQLSGGCEDKGICDSVAHYDSRNDANWVATNKHWLAFISAESHPKSGDCDIPVFGDLLPRNMDDSIIPISAQYTPEADSVFYGKYCHSALHQNHDARVFMAKTIARYIFGEVIKCGHLFRSGKFSHKSGVYVGTPPIPSEHWEDVEGDALACSGIYSHMNRKTLFIKHWKDKKGCTCPNQQERSSFEVEKASGCDPWTGIDWEKWASDDPHDCRISIKTYAGFRNKIRVNWKVYHKGLLPPSSERDHYEVEVTRADKFTGIDEVRWVTDDPLDCRIRIDSWALQERLWIEIEWRVYCKKKIRRQLIEEIPIVYPDFSE